VSQVLLALRSSSSSSGRSISRWAEEQLAHL
jgi:hypothetical protein